MSDKEYQRITEVPDTEPVKISQADDQRLEQLAVDAQYARMDAERLADAYDLDEPAYGAVGLPQIQREADEIAQKYGFDTDDAFTEYINEFGLDVVYEDMGDYRRITSEPELEPPKNLKKLSEALHAHLPDGVDSSEAINDVTHLKDGFDEYGHWHNQWSLGVGKNPMNPQQPAVLVEEISYPPGTLIGGHVEDGEVSGYSIRATDIGGKDRVRTFPRETSLTVISQEAVKAHQYVMETHSQTFYQQQTALSQIQHQQTSAGAHGPGVN